MPHVPLQPASAPVISAETPVLFVLADLALWPTLAGEIRRLGSTKDISWSGTDDGRLLLRVLGPPYYSLLRALADRPAGINPAARPAPAARPLVAYHQQTPGVWVEAGFRQPLAGQLAPPAGQIVLIRAPHSCEFLPAPEFRRVLAELPLPARPLVSSAASPSTRLTVGLRLVACASHEPAELWVLRDRPRAQLEALLSDSEDSLLAGLAVAVLDLEGQPQVILRAHNLKQLPPVLVLDAECHRAYLKLPNLFAPVGLRLQPALRRDVVRQLLARVPSQVTWLRPGPKGTFVAQSVSAAAFVPLPDCVEYLLEGCPLAHTAWEQSSAYQLENFQAREQGAGRDHTAELVRDQLRPLVLPKPKAPERRGLLEPFFDWVRERIPRCLSRPGAETPNPPRLTGKSGEPGDAGQAPPEREVEACRQSVAQRPVHQPSKAAAPAQTSRLEERFRALAGPLDGPERQALWPELAGRYEADGCPGEAALCWVNSLWEPETPAPAALLGWYRAEAREAGWPDTPEPLDRCLDASSVSAADIRALAAGTAWCAEQETLEPARLPRLRQLLETHEPLLPVRSAWLAWLALARKSGDILTLARARDRLLERLYRRGLSLDQDVPRFIRPGRAPPLHDWLLQQREPIHRWIERLHAHRPPDRSRQSPYVLATEQLLGQQPPFGSAGEALCTRAYADLTLAWGLARLGADDEAHACRRQADSVLGDRDPIHRFLLEAYGYRIEQVLAGRPAAGPLREAQLERLRTLDALQRYKIDWLRQQSRVLEPSERIDPFRGAVQRDYFDELNPILARLAEVPDRAELAGRLQHLLDAPPTGSNAAARVLRTALELAPRIGEQFAGAVLERAAAALDQAADTPEAALLLEKALFVAAHFEQMRYVHDFVARCHKLLERRQGPAAARTFASLAEQSFRGLRKLGMRAEIDRLNRQMADCILEGQDLAAARARLGRRFVEVLPTLLQLASAWLYEGDDARALVVLDDVRSLLLAGKLPPAAQTRLAGAYAASLGQAPVPLALERIEELFARLERVHDTLSTRSHFALAPLALVEAVVLAVVDANFLLGAAVRRWLDEDEHLVRRRIHRDVRQVMGAEPLGAVR